MNKEFQMQWRDMTRVLCHSPNCPTNKNTSSNLNLVLYQHWDSKQFALVPPGCRHPPANSPPVQPLQTLAGARRWALAAAAGVLGWPPGSAPRMGRHHHQWLLRIHHWTQQQDLKNNLQHLAHEFEVSGTSTSWSDPLGCLKSKWARQTSCL